MKVARYAVTFAGLMLLAWHLPAQDKPASEVKSPSPPAVLKLQVTITEHDGEKKVANLPYIFYLHAGDGGGGSPWTKLRMGSRVPVYVGKDSGMQYLDVGTNIDARGITATDGRYDISLTVERSWVEGDVLVPTEKSAAGSEPGPAQFKEPIIRQFKTDLALTMRDGQTTQSTQATDPLSGRLLTLTVTMNVAK